mgnify:FL=1
MFCTSGTITRVFEHHNRSKGDKDHKDNEADQGRHNKRLFAEDGAAPKVEAP